MVNVGFVMIECRKNKFLLSYFHSGAYINSQWTCCGKLEKQIPGCRETFISLEKKGKDIEKDSCMLLIHRKYSDVRKF